MIWVLGLLANSSLPVLLNLVSRRELSYYPLELPLTRFFQEELHLKLNWVHKTSNLKANHKKLNENFDNKKRYVPRKGGKIESFQKKVAQNDLEGILAVRFWMTSLLGIPRYWFLQQHTPKNGKIFFLIFPQNSQWNSIFFSKKSLSRISLRKDRQFSIIYAWKFILNTHKMI